MVQLWVTVTKLARKTSPGPGYCVCIICIISGAEDTCVVFVQAEPSRGAAAGGAEHQGHAGGAQGAPPRRGHPQQVSYSTRDLHMYIGEGSP
jgi:hypothetical protein